jgi:adenosylhomocysteine nucleosidase
LKQTPDRRDREGIFWNWFCFLPPMTRKACYTAFVFGLLLVSLARASSPFGPRTFDPELKPFTALVAAYEPEIKALLEALEARADATITETLEFRGVTYYLGTFRDEPIVIYLSGVSVPNAAMTTQQVIDYFPVRRLLFSGIAGGLNPALTKGDVSVAGRWAYHDESAYFNPDPENAGTFVVADYYRNHSWAYAENRPDGADSPGFTNFGMIFPDTVEVRTSASPEPTSTAWFHADPGLLEAAEAARSSVADLQNADNAPIHYLVGGNDVTGSVFVDNAAYREWLHTVWDANVTEMESAAVGHVCLVNEVPWLIIRGVSDLAGGQTGKNEENFYDTLASENAAAVLFAVLEQLVPKE